MKQEIKNVQTDQYPTGADPGLFLGGGALVPCSTSTPINHIVFSFFCRIPVVLENRRSSQSGGVRFLHPPPRSAPAPFLTCPKTLFQCEAKREPIDM